MAQIKITLVNGAGKNFYTQLVAVYASKESPVKAAKVGEDKKNFDMTKSQIEKVDSPVSDDALQVLLKA